MFPMKIPNVYSSAPPFGGCSQTCSSTPCMCFSVQVETPTAQACIFMAWPLFSVGLGPPRPRPSFPFLFSWRLTRLGPPGILVGPSPWSEMTRAADIQWLPRFITDVYPVRRGGTGPSEGSRAQSSDRTRGAASTRERRLCSTGTLPSGREPPEGRRAQDPETALSACLSSPASALQA